MNLILLLIVYLIHITNSQRQREHMPTDYTNQQVNRTIDLTSNIIRIETHILIKSMKVDPIHTYRLPLLKNNTKNLIHIDARFEAQTDNEVIKLKITKEHGKTGEDKFDFYEISFKSESMNFEEERMLIITEDYFERLEMLPKKIALKDDQFVLFKDTINHVSFYPTLHQYVKVRLLDPKVQVV
jgi:hypothetical protein